MPKTERRYGSKKTTTPKGKAEYQKDYMRDFRVRQQNRLKFLESEVKRLNQMVAVLQNGTS